MKVYDLIGIGLGPFNLSLAALIHPLEDQNVLFLDQNDSFRWHPELHFDDATMQTSYLKDLVTPVDPTNKCSFLNYLVAQGQFYSFLNTERKTITRMEFEHYARWVCEQIKDVLAFSQRVEAIQQKGDLVEVITNRGRYLAKNICVGTGPSFHLPAWADGLVDEHVFHAKSPHLSQLDATGKDIAIVGGGQTGLEVFFNLLKGKWGKAKSVKLVTRRKNLEPLDESPFVNDYFTPKFQEEFWDLPAAQKIDMVDHQKLASDGNTPSYLLDLYRFLYMQKYVTKNDCAMEILPSREVTQLVKVSPRQQLSLWAMHKNQEETITADKTILCTGLRVRPPQCLSSLGPLIEWGSDEMPLLNKNYSFKLNQNAPFKIYGMNFSRYQHGIADPQTSLMAHRSATIINDLLGKNIYLQSPLEDNFCLYA